MTPGTPACWRTIGVWGDRSCPELPPLVHCRNCPVFVGASRELLDRPVDPAYLDWLTETVATRADEEAPPDRVVLVFRAAGEWFGIDADRVRAVVPPTVVRRLPHRADPAFLGLVAVRGDLVPCIALTKLLALPEATPAGTAAPAESGLLLVLEDRTGATALVVDAARGVEGIRTSETRPVPDTIGATLQPVAAGLHAVGDVEVTLLDGDALALRVRGVLA
ncbi:MAG: chemotaxis protein CheW [Chloroflexota bacterium]